MTATVKFLERKVISAYRDKDMSLDVNSADNTIIVVHTQAFGKVIKNSLSHCMIFVEKNVMMHVFLRMQVMKLKRKYRCLIF